MKKFLIGLVVIVFVLVIGYFVFGQRPISVVNTNFNLDLNSVKVGQKYGDFTVKSFGPCKAHLPFSRKDNYKIEFSGTSKIEGEYSYRYSEFGNDYPFTFNANILGIGLRNFTVSDYLPANKKLVEENFKKETSGRAKMTIGNLRMQVCSSDFTNYADLFSVDDVEVVGTTQGQKDVALFSETSKKDFVSTKLGISFNYKLDKENLDNGIFEKGNIVYVYPKTVKGNNNPEEGQFVEVFDKSVNESFQDAIKRIILDKYPSKFCIVSTYENSVGPKELIFATIKYPPPTNPESDPFWSNAKMCNSSYAESNGIRYFAYDPKYPDRFFFFDIGQYAIITADGKLWQQSFEVLPKS